jgi:Cd2+/Zn2+-exporting ATPase
MSMTDRTRPEDAGLHPGVVQAEWDRSKRAVVIDYLPGRISDNQVEQLAAELGQRMTRPWEKTVFHLRGRACEACAVRLEGRAERIQGVRRATATFLGGTMTVTYDRSVLTEDEVVERLREAGARVSRPDATGESRWTETRTEVICVCVALVSLVAAVLAPKIGAPGWLASVLYAISYLTGGAFGVMSAWESLRGRTLDVDLLMVLAALGAAAVGRPGEGALLLFLFSLSNVLQGLAMDRTRRAIQALMKLRPDTALVKRGADLVSVAVEQLAVGDVMLVRPGSNVPLDGVVVSGSSHIDESSLTGESMPVSKEPGAFVYGGTTNQTGALDVRVERLARDSTLVKMVRLVEEAQTEKAQTQRFLDRFEQHYAAGVILLTIALILIPWLGGWEAFGKAFYRAMTVMVVASPCALVISTPAAILSAIGGAARRGVLFKGGAHLERAAGVRVVAFDKTGTLTEGRPRVTDVVWGGAVHPAGGDLPDGALALLRDVDAVESRSEHPLARAVRGEAARRGIPAGECTDFQSFSGKGVMARTAARRLAVGSLRFFDDREREGFDSAEPMIASLQNDGKTCLVAAEISEDGRTARFAGAVAVADVLRTGVADVVQQLHAAGIRRVVMLTGDNRRVAEAIGREAGVDEVHAELMPADKVRLVHELRALGPVAMVGDGVNDAPALAAAAVGVAMGGAGTDIAMETADIVLVRDDPALVVVALRISRQARRVVIQNLTFALAVIAVLVVGALGGNVPLPLGVVGHEGSTVIVCLNGLRLLMAR